MYLFDVTVIVAAAPSLLPACMFCLVYDLNVTSGASNVYCFGCLNCLDAFAIICACMFVLAPIVRNMFVCLFNNNND